MVERVLPFVTVFSGRPEIDVASADPTVLSALPGMTPQILGAVLKARANDPGDGRALLELLGPARSAPQRTDRKHSGPQLRSNSTTAGVFTRKSCFVSRTGGKDQAAKDQGDEPYDFLYWRDDFDGPMQSA